MSAETDYRALLAAHSGLAALVGTRIAANGVPQDAPYPLVVFTSAHTPDLALDNTLLADQVIFATQCWADTAAGAAAVAAQLRAALAGNPNYIVVAEESGFDEELNLDAVVLTVERWIT